jgi:hypothetical protein
MSVTAFHRGSRQIKLPGLMSGGEASVGLTALKDEVDVPNRLNMLSRESPSATR